MVRVFCARARAPPQPTSDYFLTQNPPPEERVEFSVQKFESAGTDAAEAEITGSLSCARGSAPVYPDQLISLPQHAPRRFGRRKLFPPRFELRVF